MKTLTEREITSKGKIMDFWRGKIGLLVPSCNITMEPEFWQHVPEGVSIHSSRMPLVESTKKGFNKMDEEIEEAVEFLSDCEVDVIVYGCTTGSLRKGKGYMREIEEKISRISGIPSISTASAVIKALNALELRKLDVFTPYVQWLNEKEAEFLTQYGFEILNMRGLEIEKGLDMGKVMPQKTYAEAKKLSSSESDALFISCTNLHTFEIIKPLERDLEKSVITSNQATLWLALRNIKVKLKTDTLGELFSNL